MFTGEFTFDLNQALNPMRQQQYACGYSYTNEPIEKWLNLIPVKNPRILTVAASGDQPLMYAAHGAAHVDTFDITINACTIMDFKTAALQHMTFAEYQTAILALKRITVPNADLTHPQIAKCKNFTEQHFNQTIRLMPERTRALMQQIINRHIHAFLNDSTCLFPKDEQTYTQMQKTVKQPFRFIWADLQNVPHYTTEKYDIINISNIFDHYFIHGEEFAFVPTTLEKLCPILRPGGYIICTTVSYAIAELFNTAPTFISDLNLKTHLYEDFLDRFLPITIQKTR